MGRPSKYSPEIAKEVIERLSAGEPLAKICRDEHVPAARTISDWKEAHPEFSADFARAREEGFDAIALETLEIADFGERDTVETEDGREIVNHDVIQRSKLRVETRLKLLAKWDPKRYGDRQVIAGDPDAPLRGLSDEDLDAKIAAKLVAAGISNG